MEDEREVFILDASWKFDLEECAAIIESNDEEGGCGCDWWGLGVELLEIVFGPLIDSFGIDSVFVLRH